MERTFSIAKLPSAVLRLASPALTGIQTIIKLVSATNDKAATVLSFWRSSQTVKLTTALAAAAGQKLISLNDTTGIVDDDVCLIQSTPGVYEVIDIDTVVANVSLTTKVNLVNNYPAGTKIYVFKSGGGVSPAHYNIPVGIATVEKENDTAIIASEEDQAILAEFDSCTTICDFFVSGKVTDNA